MVPVTRSGRREAGDAVWRADTVADRAASHAGRAAAQQHASDAILVSPPEPRHRAGRARLVAPPGHEVEILIGGIHHIDSAPEAGIGMEYVIALLVEHADPRQVRARGLLPGVVVVDLAAGELVGRERHAEVVVEAGAAGRYPLEGPAEPPRISLQLGQRRARDRDHRDVAVGEVLDDAVEVVGPERARLAAGLPVGAEHEVVDDELAAAVEQVGEARLAARAGELVVLGDLDPGQVAARGGEPLALVGELLLAGEQLLAGLEPLGARNDLVCVGRHGSWIRRDRAGLGVTNAAGFARRTWRGAGRAGQAAAMDPELADAARALAAGDPLRALKRVALRDDGAGLALRGIAM